MQEHQFSTSRSARYFTLGSPQHAADVWLVCHGYGQLASRFLERFRPIEAERRCIVAPEGLSRFYLTEHPAERRVGASWMTREDRLHEIDDYVRYLDGVYGNVVPRTARRSEEHTSELQSRLHLVCRLLLEKKKKNKETRGRHDDDCACRGAHAQP